MITEKDVGKKFKFVNDSLTKNALPVENTHDKDYAGFLNKVVTLLRIRDNWVDVIFDDTKIKTTGIFPWRLEPIEKELNYSELIGREFRVISLPDSLRHEKGLIGNAYTLNAISDNAEPPLKLDCGWWFYPENIELMEPQLTGKITSFSISEKPLSLDEMKDKSNDNELRIGDEVKVITKKLLGCHAVKNIEMISLFGLAGTVKRTSESLVWIDINGREFGLNKFDVKKVFDCIDFKPEFMQMINDYEGNYY